MNPQRSEEWHKERLGKITGSRVGDILGTPLKRNRIMAVLAAEILTGKWKEAYAKSMQWGIDNEPKALNCYEFKYGVRVQASGFTPHFKYPDTMGCSLDGLLYRLNNTKILAEGEGIIDELQQDIIEIKCPYASENHILTLENGMPKEHIPQVQFNMWNVESDLCKFISYDPRMPEASELYVQEIPRDDEYITKMEEKLLEFQEDLDKLVEKLR